MASLGSVFDRDILLRTINANPERLTPFWTSGAFNTSGQIRSIGCRRFATFEVPYIMDIDGDLGSELIQTKSILILQCLAPIEAGHHARSYGFPKRAFH